MPFRPYILSVSLSLCLWASTAHAQQLILDEDLTNTANALTQPLRPTLAPQQTVRYVLVNSPDINAFVTAENIIYLHSGLILKAKSAAELQGVLAHEMAHITAHHILQQDLLQKQALATMLAGAVAGVGAMAAGSGQAGGAILMAGQAGGLSNLLAHTRTQEEEADRLAATALHKAGYSTKGMVDMFTTLRTESQLSYNSPPPWLVTHPLPPERLATLTGLLNKEDKQLNANTPVPEETFRQLQAKVFALTNSPASTLRKYAGADTISRYARSLAYTNQGKLKEAEETLQPLLKAHPNHASYQQLAATIATEKGELEKAISILLKLLNTHPSAFLPRYQLAEVLRANNQPEKALPHYQRVVREWPEWNDPWHGLSMVYGQTGKLAEAQLSLAEAALQEFNPQAAKQALALAENYLKKSPSPQAQNWAETLHQRLKDSKE